MEDNFTKEGLNDNNVNNHSYHNSQSADDDCATAFQKINIKLQQLTDSISNQEILLNDIKKKMGSQEAKPTDVEDIIIAVNKSETRIKEKIDSRSDDDLGKLNETAHNEAQRVISEVTQRDTLNQTTPPPSHNVPNANDNLFSKMIIDERLNQLFVNVKTIDNKISELKTISEQYKKVNIKLTNKQKRNLWITVVSIAILIFGFHYCFFFLKKG